MVYLYLIAKIYKIQFLRVKVTRFYFARHGFPARENMSDIFQNTRHIFQNMCLVFFICSRGAPTRWKKIPVSRHGKTAIFAARFTPGFPPSAPPGGKAGYKKGMPRRRGDFLRRGTGFVFYSQERRQWSVIIGSNAKLLTLSSPGSPSTYQLTCMLRNTASTAEGSSVREGCHLVQNNGRPKR